MLNPAAVRRTAYLHGLTIYPAVEYVASFRLPSGAHAVLLAAQDYSPARRRVEFAVVVDGGEVAQDDADASYFWQHYGRAMERSG